MTPEQMSQLIKSLRGAQSLREFAAKCGVSHTTIDNLERGVDPRTGKPPQIKMATFSKIIEACGLPSVLALSTFENEDEAQQLVNAICASSAPSLPRDELWQKISQLDELDRVKADAFVSGLLAAEKYQEPTHKLKIAARGGGVKEITVTDSQLQQIMNLPEVTDLGDKN